MATLPAQFQAPETPRGSRREHLTFPYLAAELDSHFQSTQLAVCYRSFQLQAAYCSISVQYETVPGDAPGRTVFYIALCCRCQVLPTLNPEVHITIGTWHVLDRVYVSNVQYFLDYALARWSPLTLTLAPYGRGCHWQVLTSCSAWHFLSWARARVSRVPNLRALWEPDFHITWNS